MSYPPPPGLKPPHSSSPHPSLPTKPPAPSAGFKPAFSAAPSSGASFPQRPGTAGPQGWSTHSPATAVGPSQPPSYNEQGAFGGYQQQQTYYHQPADAYAQPTPPQIRNPFAPPTAGGSGANAGNYDPEMEAQIAQWQSAYSATETKPRTGLGASATTTSYSSAPTHDSAAAPAPARKEAAVPNAARPDGKQATVVRSGGGQTWQDSSLLEWDPAHFRIFVGNLAGEVTDESLLKAFSRYPSVQKARVVRDKRTTKSKGFGFVSFSDGDDYFQAARDMNGKYIGSHPVLIKKSTTEIKPVNPHDNKKKGKNHGKGGGGGSGANTGAGVQKKQQKTKGGLKILG